MDGLRQPWLRMALLAGALYLVFGITFATLAGSAASPQMRVTWRLTAWILSAAVFGAHITYEHLRRRTLPRATAWHAGFAVALGALALAAVAAIHNRRVLPLALLLWPLLTGIPAYVVALLAASGLAAVARRANGAPR